MYLVFDLETEDRVVFKRVANPWYNKILAAGFKWELLDTPHAFELSDNQPLDNSYLQTALEDVDLLIGHNIKFDLLYLWSFDALKDFFKRGGRIWCTQLAEYILSGQRHKYPALRDIAVNKYGRKERTKWIEDSYKQGLSTTQMPKELLVTDVKNDVLDTEQVYTGQLLVAQNKQMLNLIRSQMNALLATTEIEYNGIKVDKEILIKNRDQLKEELLQARQLLMNLVNKYWKYE